MTVGQTPSVSVVVPAHNEVALLPRLLDTLEVARARFSAGAAAVEVIVADDASTDGTGALAAARGCRVVRLERRRIAAARNAGASVARGPILAFVDADSQVHPGTFDALVRAMRDPRWVAAASGVRLERMSPGIALTYALMVPWVWVLRMDTGVVGCRREDFVAIGGYDEARAFGEDVRLLWDLRRLGRRRGQRLVRLRRVKAVASTRKFDTWGDWHYLTTMVRLLPELWRRSPATPELARRYWYGDDR